MIRGQGVVITETTGVSTPHASSILDVRATDKGMLIPRLTTVQRQAIASPANGLLVYDTDENSFFYYDATKGGWVGVVNYNPQPAEDEPIFVVRNSEDKIVFAVYEKGVRMYVEDDAKESKGNKSGFAIGGLTGFKDNETEYFRVTPDSVRIYLREPTEKGNKGGFAIGGLTGFKADTVALMFVAHDSTRFYIDTEPVAGGGKGNKGGFAIGGLTGFKNLPEEYLRVTRDSTRVSFSTEVLPDKGNKSGFAIGGLTGFKGEELPSFFNVSADTTRVINPSEARILWYPSKNAFMTGQVLIEKPDSVGMNSFSSGFESKAIGNYSQALGYEAIARGHYSTAIGKNALAHEDNSFAFGDSAIAKGIGSYAIGSVGRLPGGASTGIPTTALGEHSVSIGMGAYTSKIGAIAFGNESEATGLFSSALGYKTQATGDYSTAMGYESQANGNYSLSSGYRTKADGLYAIALGYNSWAVGEYALALGANSTAGRWSVALGESSQAIGDWSTAMGSTNTASGDFSTAMGTLTIASGEGSLAGGFQSGATGDFSTAFGHTSIASGSYSFAIGSQAKATNYFSFAFGDEVEANGQSSYAFGGGIKVNGNYSYAIALSDQFSTTVTQANTMAIMGGKVGIGTVAPSELLELGGTNSKLSLNSSTSNTILFNNQGVAVPTVTTRSAGTKLVLYPNITSSAVDYALGISSNTLWYSIPQATSTFSHIFYAGTSEIMRIRGDGNVGIGASSPALKLHIKQNVADAAFRIEDYLSTHTWDLGIASSTDNLNFIFDGVIKAQIVDSNGNYYQPSDKSLKKNVENIGYILDKIIMLKPSMFHFNEEENDQPKSLGFIAQEVELVFPELVKEFESRNVKYKSLSYDDFAILSIQAIIDLNNKLEDTVKQQNETINSYRKEIEKLKAEMEVIKAMIVK